MEILDRKAVRQISVHYKEVLRKESHHKHELIMIDGVIRWKGNDKLRPVDVGEATRLFYTLGYGKNSEVYRKFYRDLGYSLSGYWEIFYWEMNNDKADEYRPSLFKRFLNIFK